MEQLQGAGDPLEEVHLVPLGPLEARPGDPADLGHGRKAIVQLGQVPVGFPRIAPRPVDAEPSFARRVRPRHVVLVVGPAGLLRRSHSHVLPLFRFRAIRRPSDAREVSKRLDAGQEEVGAASDGGEGRQPCDLLPDRPLRDLEFQRAVLLADDRIALVAEFVEIPVIDPHVLRELELADEARADHEGRDPALHAVLRRAFRQRRAVGGAAADHAAPVHVRGRVARIHAPDVRAERHGIPVRVHLLVVEVVVPLRVGPERRIVLVRRQHERGAAAPAAHELRGDEFLFLRRLAVLRAGSRGTRRRAPPAGGRP